MVVAGSLYDQTIGYKDLIPQIRISLSPATSETEEEENPATDEGGPYTIEEFMIAESFDTFLSYLYQWQCLVDICMMESLLQIGCDNIQC